GNELEQWDLARHVIGQADAICRRLGDRPALRAVVENNRGNLEGGQDHHPQAYEHHRRAVELWERLHGAAHPRVARAYGNLSIDARKLGRLDESLTLAQRSLEQLQAALGPEHPDLQMAHQNLGNLFADQQQPERAIEHFRRALAIAERSEGPQGPGAVSALLSIGVVQDDFGRYPEALRTYRRALEAARAAYGEAHPKVAACLNNIGNVLQRQGQHAEALPLHESALAILVGALGEDSSETFMELNNIGAAYLGLGKPLLAEPFLTRAERRFDAARWEDKDLAELRSNQAEVRWAQGDHARALALAEEARALLAAGGARDREELRRVEAWIAGHRPTR
ncbi:MAG TPA: tetratricopeptide repeat protein, partial [Myxococcota bacterium]|nr:tetratricopeptide repeat protein [Myxococcota bacterium]